MTDQQRQPPGASHESDSNPEAAADLAWLTEHQLQGQVSKVAPNTARSNNLLKQAQTHINSARARNGWGRAGDVPREERGSLRER